MSTQEFTLRAMAENYRNGHSWDHLDGEACIAAADEIKMLRSLLPPALPSFSNDAAPASAAEPVRDEARDIIAEFVRLADMGYEDSLKETEENGNFAVYERAKKYLALTAAPASAAEPGTVTPQPWKERENFAFDLDDEMVERLDAIASRCEKQGIGILASAEYHGQGQVNVPAKWLRQIIAGYKSFTVAT